jgi:hypothetical protein
MYFLSIYVGHYLVVGGLRVFRGSGQPHPKASCIERFIYSSSLLLGLPYSLIGGWLVLKGLAKFDPRGEGRPSTDQFLDDYYAYLIGTGLSLIVGVGFGLLGRLLTGRQFVPSADH